MGLDDPSKPLRSKLLAVPALRERYLRHVRAIAQTWLDWERLGPVVDGHARRIEPFLAADTRKLSSLEAFRRAVSSEPPDAAPGETPPGPGRRVTNLKQFAEQRRKFLLNHPAIVALPAEEEAH